MIADAPELDAEAMFLCAAMWARDVERIATVAELVLPDDFERPSHAIIYATWCEQARAGRPHDAASIAARLADAGEERAPRTVHSALRGITTLGAEPVALGWYAIDVATAAYRRSFLAVAEAVAHAAAAAPTGELFPILVQYGTRQRKESRRLAELRRRLGADPEDGSAES
ncbi:DnaB-like helicase N-terminal domain-containing protein [Tomitella fengzijianii]|uniref:DNA helicase n=1 Tax=Tomitella fengzijianii TaxID=2597660 RepID=A0A516X0Z2_9ACTN|nr:DnaB-like helicase N-terminal domain-containing protein [Tomitella fengzijianii]QDQ96271.1 DNA helicase [Tomitella fengzijianii]